MLSFLFGAFSQFRSVVSLYVVLLLFHYRLVTLGFGPSSGTRIACEQVQETWP